MDLLFLVGGSFILRRAVASALHHVLVFDSTAGQLSKCALFALVPLRRLRRCVFEYEYEPKNGRYKFYV